MLVIVDVWCSSWLCWETVIWPRIICRRAFKVDYGRLASLRDRVKVAEPVLWYMVVVVMKRCVLVGEG